ncbi:MAG: bifunctional alpha,alpha-trehalose-phosphate synthase (UDP-forming)/trehalose-phosphatase [Saprospiraceae bacterium]|nr:bifunctional alpha,alpha-trehalose-phosphate synthase (UDP-forming)/trehalose-phosphatase [Saprospiraceae bacterium]
MRLIIISNRLPLTIDKKEGELIYHPSAGGLATGLASLDDSFDRVWVGWPGREFKDEWEQEAIRKDLLGKDLVPVFLNKKDITLYYEGFSNKTIWPHFHYFTQFTTYRDSYWEAYKRVNQKFADAILPLLQPDDLVWVHDYQLMLLPSMIRKVHPDISIGFFLHIPFPSYEIFRVLPWRRAILEGVLGADQIGFHTFGYMRHFLSAAYRITGYEHHFGKLNVSNRLINVDVFPMGINYEKYAFPEFDLYKDDGATKIKQMAKANRLIISIDRLDYTKGIPQRLKAFEQFISLHPRFHGKVSLVMVVVPSRSNVDQYKELKEEVDTMVGRINSTYGTFDWMPIRYFYRSLNFEELITLYQEADIAMITPLRDGMNLVAKEYVASKEKSKKGVLILSEMAGASNELTEALSVNPQDINDMAHKLVTALEMNEKEQRWRLEKMQEKLKKYDVSNWASTFIKEQVSLMEQQKHDNVKRFSEKDREKLLHDFHQAPQKLIFLDYDGTLMDFQPDPQAVVPDEELLEILEKLVAIEGAKVVLNSGRDKQTLEKWLGHFPMDMAAEHGVWIKQNNNWRRNPNVSYEWKKNIRPVLEDLVERTPGSFIEEKDFSIAWHYRRIDKALGEKRVREFRDVLLYLTANLDLQVLEGNKVVEIKNAGVNKGKASLNWVNSQDWDFMMALGDDHTDEDTFEAMPESAYSIKVGIQKTNARFQMLSVSDVRSLLRALVS